MHQNPWSTQPVDHLGCHIAHADRAAGRHHQQIGLGQRLGRGRLQRLQLIGDDGKGDGLGPRLAGQRGQRLRIDVTHLARPRLLIRRDHLIPLGEDRRHRPRRHIYLDDAQRQQTADVLGPDDVAGRQHSLPLPHIFADLDHVLAGGHGAVNLDGVGGEIGG